jgi:hypothetical protein
MAGNRNLQRMIHVGCKQLGLDDDTRAVGEGIIGSFGSNTNFMIGYMAANIVLNEDVSRSPAVLNLLQTYARAEARTN